MDDGQRLEAGSFKKEAMTCSPRSRSVVLAQMSTTIIAPKNSLRVRVAGSVVVSLPFSFFLVIEHILDFWSAFVSVAQTWRGRKEKVGHGGRSLVANTGRDQAGQKRTPWNPSLSVAAKKASFREPRK